LPHCRRSFRWRPRLRICAADAQWPLTHWNPQYGYRFPNLAPPEEGNSDSLFVVTSFSGGGTRASALSFGALRVLARQSIRWEGKEKRLLDELDVIYALSGGPLQGPIIPCSATAFSMTSNIASCGKTGKELKHRILRSPSNWLRLWSPYFGRIHIMAELLDEALYEGKTYGDLLIWNHRRHLEVSHGTTY
jgi:NTE family protein